MRLKPGFVKFTTSSAPLLDTYTGANVAYSFRKLRTAYAGSAVRIRRSSDNAEADIGFSGNDFDSAAAATHIGGGSGFIVTWYDQSGNGGDVTQATAGNQPTYTASGIGSKPGMTLASASSQFLKGVNVVNQGAGTFTALSCAAVASMESTGSDGRLVGLIANDFYGEANDFNTNGAIPIIRSGANQTVLGYQAGNGGSKAITYSSPDTFMSLFDGTNHTMYWGGAAGTPVSRALSLAHMKDLYLCGSSGTFWDGQCSEVIIWLTDQTANVAAIDADQAAYWGI